MPSNVRKTLDRMRQSRSGFINNEAFARNLNRSLSFDPINTIYVRGTSEYEDKFIDQTARRDDSIIPKLIYGEVWLDAQVINRGIKRSTADPSQLVDEFEIVNGIGKNDGIKNDPNEDTEDGLNNLVINGLAAVLGGIAAYQLADFVYKRSNDSGNSIWDDVTDFVGKEVFGNEDPNTGEEIEEQTNVNQPKLEQLSNVESSSASKDDIIIFGKNGENCGWLHKNFNQAIIDSGLDVLGLTVQDSGTDSDTDIDTLNFGDNLAVTVDGNGKITIDGSGGSSGSTSGNNLGSGSQVFKDKTSDTLNFRTLEAGSNVTLTQNADTIIIAASATGGGNNDGGGAGGVDGIDPGVCKKAFVTEAVPGRKYHILIGQEKQGEYVAQSGDTVNNVAEGLFIDIFRKNTSEYVVTQSDNTVSLLPPSDPCNNSCTTKDIDIAAGNSLIASSNAGACGAITPTD